MGNRALLHSRESRTQQRRRVFFEHRDDPGGHANRFGAPWMPRAKFLMCWSRPGGTSWAALKLMRKLPTKYRFVRDKLVTDDLRSYAAAAAGDGLVGAYPTRGTVI